jgi:hypothetical protein
MIPVCHVLAWSCTRTTGIRGAPNQARSPFEDSKLDVSGDGRRRYEGQGGECWSLMLLAASTRSCLALLAAHCLLLPCRDFCHCSFIFDVTDFSSPTGTQAQHQNCAHSPSICFFSSTTFTLSSNFVLCHQHGNSFIQQADNRLLTALFTTPILLTFIILLCLSDHSFSETYLTSIYG